MSPNPKMERQKSHALLQLQCFLDFTHKSFKLKDLAHSDKINPLFSRFCAREGGGGTPTNSKFKSLAKGAKGWPALVVSQVSKGARPGAPDVNSICLCGVTTYW